MVKNNSNGINLPTIFSGPSNNGACSIDIDIEKDLNDIAKDYLKKEHIQLKHEKEPYLDYLIYQLQVVENRPRVIKYSKSFSCPSNYKSQLAFIENKIKKGESLKPFFTKRITNLNNCDYLLYDWGVYHLHLSNYIGRSGIAMRSNYLLLAIIKPDTVYFLGVVAHNNVNLWEDKNILDIMKNNWPELINPYCIKNVVELAQNYSDEDIKKLRRNNINYIVNLTDAFAVGPGNGYALDGTPQKAVIQKLSDFKLLYSMTKSIKFTIPNIINKNPAEFGVADSKIIMVKLLIFNKKFKLLKINGTNIYILMQLIDECWIYTFADYNTIMAKINTL